MAGTMISTEDGFTPIEEIKVGDRVWSEDTVACENALKKVKKVFVREKDSIIRLSINGEVINTTEEHPFWVKDQGWIPAGSLHAGDIVKLQSGEYVPIEEYQVVILDEPIPVYNFHVEDFGCYYVSEQNVLVHNNDSCGEQQRIQLKRIGNNKRANEVARKEGYNKAEDFKESYVGKKNISKFDMKVNPKTGEVVLENKRTGAQIHTRCYLND